MEKFDIGVAPANLTRVIFLSTYINYDGVLMADNNRPLNKKQIFQILNISNSLAHIFWKEVIEKNIIIDNQNDTYSINQNILFKGNLHGKYVAQLAEQNRSITRIYIDTMRELYSTATHKFLSHIYAILPFVNRHHNILCRNPWESDAELIEPITMGDVCDVVGYSRSNARRLKKEMASCTVYNKRQKRDQYLVGFVSIGSRKIENNFIMINPIVYYGGSRHSDVSKLFNESRFNI
ncbi:MAG: hypothetical protein PHV07_01625 [Oscillospiraceae bacterium]|nr:hypothetical protein [Oscillospiraceae bacterium]